MKKLLHLALVLIITLSSFTVVSASYYKGNYPFDNITGEASPTNITLKAGNIYFVKFGYDSKIKKYKLSNNKVANLSAEYTDCDVLAIAGLKKGTSKLTVTTKKGTKYSFNIKVTSNPKLTKNGKKIDTITVRKGKCNLVKIKGKVNDKTKLYIKGIDNKYINTKKAKIISKTDSTALKIKGIKKGTTTLKVKVNGSKTLKIKVKVI